MKKGNTNLVLSIICLIFILLTLIPLFLTYSVGPGITRRVMEHGVEIVLQKKVEVEDARITIFGGLGVEYKKVRILAPDGKEFFRAKAVVLKPWIQSLILGRLRWKSVALREPSLHVIRTSQGHIGVHQKGGEKGDREAGPGFPQIMDMETFLPSHLSVRRGRIRLTDFGVSKNPVVTEIEGIEMKSQAISLEKPFPFSLTGRFAGSTGERISVSGKVIRVDETFDPTRLGFEFLLKADSIDSQRIWPYIRSRVPFESVEGLFDLRIDYRGGLTAFHSSGEVRIRRGQFSLPTLYRKTIKPKEVSLVYELDYGKQGIHISQVALRVPPVSLLGKGSVQRIHSRNQSISIEFTTGRTPLGVLRPYLPDRLIPESYLSILADSPGEGTLWVEKVRLEGPWANLTLEGVRKNPEMISIRLRLDNCSFRVDPRLPPVRHVSGLIDLSGNQLDFTDFHGQFRHSRFFELNGMISKIYSKPKAVVAFKGDLDLRGLFSLLKGRRMPRRVRKALDWMAGISGKAKMTGEIRYLFGKLADLTYKGRIALRDTRVGLAGVPLPLTNLAGEIRYDDRVVTFSNFKWRLGKKFCYGHASFQGYLRKLKDGLALSEKMKIFLDIEAEKIRFDDLLPKGAKKPTIEIDPKSILVNSSIRGKVRVFEGSFKGFRFEDFGTSFVAERGVLRLRYFRALAPGGFIRCRGWINLKPGQGISFKIVPEIRHLDMTNAFRIFTTQNTGPLISGTLNLDGIIAGSGNSADAITRSLRGDLRIRGGKGSLYGLRSGKKEGIPYNRVSAQILINKGIASTKDLRLDGDVISMDIEGQSNLNQKSLDILIGVRPLQTMDKILSNIPVAGWLLAGKDRSIITFQYRVRGKFDDLKVESTASEDQESTRP